MERQPGDRLGPFDLVRRLGAGGMGEVWEAVLRGPAGFRKPVALKLLRAGLVDPAIRDALVREARLGGLLQHPNVVSTWGLGESDGTWWVALELVRGLAVSEVWRAAGGRLPAGAVLEVGVQAAAGLHHVHELVADGVPAGLVHRDVKPGNLLVDRSGLVKLADLGITVLRGEAAGAAGSPGYMAPEQLEGRPGPQSDLFALAVTLFVLATGRRPFGTGQRALMKTMRVESLLRTEEFLAPIEEAVPGLGPVVSSCLRAHPADRPSSARELLDALAALRSRQRPGPTLLELLARASPSLGVQAPVTPVSQSTAPTRLLPTGNLRPPRDAFVGRAAELEHLASLVRGERWVVLLGPGGMGKTRLALEVARRRRDGLSGGAWAFDLSEAHAEDGICSAVAAGLGIELERRDPVGQLGRVFETKGRALVVLDNLEQCVEALPRTVGRWLDLAPEARFLGTSRLVPGLHGERAVAVGELLPADAVALFHAHAPRAVRDDEKPHVEALCHALEGMPLAIELAAARLRTYDAATLRSRLSLALLSGGGRDLPERQRSVAASLRWSWEQLSPPARSALGQLSVFEGGFTLRAAEAVLDLRSLPDAPWALDVLQELSDASLLRVDASAARFSMLVVVREFAAGAATPEERSGAEVRHGAFFAQLGAREAHAALAGPGGAAVYRSLAPEVDNLVAACRRATARGDGPVAVATLVAASAVFHREGPATAQLDLAGPVLGLPSLGADDRARALRCAAAALQVCGRPAEAFALVDEELALVRAQGDRGAEAVAIAALGTLHHHQARLEEARTFYEQALAMSREVGQRRAEGMLYRDLCGVHLDQGRPDEALASVEQAIAVFRELRDDDALADGLHLLAIVELDQGRPEDARVHGEAALAVHRELGDRHGEAIALVNLGSLHFALGRSDDAMAHYERALVLLREVGNLRHEGIVLGNLGSLHLVQGRPDQARAHYDEALTLQRRQGDRRSEGIVLLNLGELEDEHGRPEDARARYEEALALVRGAGDLRSEGYLLCRLARLAARSGDPTGAHALLERGAPLVRELRDPLELARLLAVQAEVLHRSGDRAGARGALEEALALSPARVDVVQELEQVGRLLDGAT